MSNQNNKSDKILFIICSTVGTLMLVVGLWALTIGHIPSGGVSFLVAMAYLYYQSIVVFRRLKGRH